MNKFTVFLLVTFLSVKAEAVEMKMITDKGYVAFTVDDNWPVLAMDTKPPVSVAGFQIPNSADENTSESTNLSISIYHSDSEQVRKALSLIGKQYGTSTPKIEKFNDWIIYRQEPKQGLMDYSLIDAKKKVADVTVSVRIAWPHLNNNPINYSTEMEAIFHSVLNSVYGNVGPYKPKDGEIIRRPTQ